MMRALRHGSSSVRVIAHRGARAFAPENTVAAVEKGFALAADMAEVDVHLSLDGELVVMHDEDLTRCTDVRRRFPGRTTYRVYNFTWAQMSQLDAGSWFVEELQKSPGVRLWPLGAITDEERRTFISSADLERYGSGKLHPPLLSECLEAARAAGRAINVEIKAIPMRYPGIATKVAGLVEQMGMRDAVLVSSFDHEQLVELRAAGPRIPTAVLTRDRLHDPAGYIGRLDADAFHPGCEGDEDALGLDAIGGPDPHLVRGLQRAGIAVHAWTANAPERIRALIAAGVDGIVSDFPNRVRQVLAECTPQ